MEFIRIFDRLFDLTNSRSILSQGFILPLTLKTKVTWEEILGTSAEYIKRLKTDDRDLLKHVRKTFALGFLVNTIHIALSI